jgi:NAD(P)-dependent dehydrogenase (short-subunit alcohol dehydrogenase family)
VTFAIELSGRTALVTGGGQGVGRAISLALASAGATVIVNDYVRERADQVAQELIASGGEAESVAFDVSDYSAVTTAIAGTSGVEILVNNAGNAGPAIGTVPPVSLGHFVASEPADWDRYFAVNLYGVMHCTRAVLPHMIGRGEGRIITIVSDAGRWGEPRMAPYAAAKAGAAGFTRALAREVGRDGITVNNVALGTIDTIGLEEMASNSVEVADRLRKQLGRYIVRRLGQPEDVAGLVTFLASPLASWITGQTYPVNGGFSFAM